MTSRYIYRIITVVAIIDITEVTAIISSTTFCTRDRLSRRIHKIGPNYFIRQRDLFFLSERSLLRFDMAFIVRCKLPARHDTDMWQYVDKILLKIQAIRHMLLLRNNFACA